MRDIIKQLTLWIQGFIKCKHPRKYWRYLKKYKDNTYGYQCRKCKDKFIIGETITAIGKGV